MQLSCWNIRTRQYTRQGTRDESEGCDTSEHQNDTVYSFKSRRGREITIANGRSGRDHEIQGHNIELILIHHIVVRVPHPRAHISIKRAKKDEHARWDMKEENEKDTEEH